MRGWNRLVRGVVLIGAIAGGTTSALAGTTDALKITPSATTPVAAVSSQVTYSKATSGTSSGQTFIAFQVGDTSPGGGYLIQNTSGNTVNNVRIKLTVTVADPGEELVLYRPMDYLPNGCLYDATLSANSYDITCTVKQLKNGAGFPGFYVFFVAPQKLVNGIADDKNTDGVSTKLEIFYSEQLNGPGSVWQNSSIDPIVQSNLVMLGTEDPVNIKSAVPKDGGSFFTGNGVPKGLGDPISTSVIVPTIPVAEQGEILEGDSTTFPGWTNVNCLNNFVACYASKITFPGTFESAPYFQVTFRVAPANFSTPGLKIESVRLFYRSDVGEARNEIFQCNPVDQPWLSPDPRYGTPCWTSRQQYRKNYRPNPDLSEVMEWKLLNTKNGFLEFD